MDRRDFLSSSLITAGVVSTIASAAAAEEKKPEHQKKNIYGVGFLTGYSPEIVKKAKEFNYDCLSVQMGFRNPVWESLKTSDGRKKFMEVFESNGVELSSFADYANHLDSDPEKRKANSDFCSDLIDVASALGVKTIAALAGRDPEKTIDDSIGDFKSVWGPLAKKAEDKGVRFAFENWVGGNDINHGINIGICPYAWRKMFDAVPSPAIGLEFDPSHLYWQGIDYLRAVREFSSKIYQVHLKDCVILTEDMYLRGCTGGSFKFCLPGWGEVKWPAFFRALWEGGFKGNVIVEHEDDMHKGDDGFRIARAYLNTLLPY